MFKFELDTLNADELKELSGVNNTNLIFLKDLFKEDIIIRGSEVFYYGDSPDVFKELLDKLISLIHKKQTIDGFTIKQIYFEVIGSYDPSWRNIVAAYTFSGKPLKFKTYNQFALAEAIKRNDLVFSIGPAGTGKTFLAVMLACKALKEDNVKKIILTRPAVEAGESLGFLPGDLQEKVNPYLMPLYDSLNEILGIEQTEKLIEKGIIEVIPLAYMRGRTLNEAFIILDEAQNTTAGQMLMFLTRFGNKSKMLINGDITQIDLNIKKENSGLVVARNKLSDVEKIVFVEFNNSDVVRNPLVEKIIEKFAD